MTWKINVNVQSWKKDQIVSEEELVAQGVVISDWETSLLIIKQGEAKPVKVKSSINFDLNNDGVVDKKDRSIAAKVLGSKKGKKRGKR